MKDDPHSLLMLSPPSLVELVSPKLSNVKCQVKFLVSTGKKNTIKIVLTPVSHSNIWYCCVSFIHVHCVKVHTVKKSRIENLNSEIGSKEAENMDRWQHTTMSSSPGRGGPAPFSRYTRILSIHSAMYTGAASMQ